MLSTTSPNGCVTTPFKGDAFPSYVLTRVSRSSRGVSSQAHRDDGAHQVDTSRHPSTSLLTSASTPTNLSDMKSSSLTAVRAPAVSSEPRATPQRVIPAAPLGASIQQRTHSSHRPSLTDQLRSISQGAADVTAHLRATHHLQPHSSLASLGSAAAVLFQVTTVGMSVGTLACRFPCPALFLRDHCAFVFQHPFAAKEIQMVMFYRDMVGARVTVRDQRFRFRVRRTLEHFGNDYDPANPQHAITIVLATASEAQRLQQFIADQRLGFGHHRT